MENTCKPFMTIKEACNYTGLSQGFLRRGVKDGSIPAVSVGAKYMINMRLFFEKMDKESEAANDKMA